MEKVHLFEFDPARGAVHENFVSTDRNFVFAGVLRHIFEGRVSGCSWFATPGAIDFHDGIGSKDPIRLGAAEFYWTSAGVGTGRVLPVGNSAVVLIANDPLIVGSFKSGEGGTVRAGPDGWAIGTNE